MYFGLITALCINCLLLLICITKAPNKTGYLNWKRYVQ